MGLTIRVVEGPRATGNCGGAMMTVEWQLGPNDSGYVIQHVIFRIGDLTCDGHPITRPRTFEYWEAWQVVNGVVYAGRASRQTRLNAANGTDFYVLPDEGDGTKGTNAIEGKVKFLPNYVLPAAFQRRKRHPAGDLPATPNAPAGWNDAGADDHTLRATWTCCPMDHRKPAVTGTPMPQKPQPRGGRIKTTGPVSRSIHAVKAWAPSAPSADRVERSLLPLRRFSLADVRKGIEQYIAACVSVGGYGIEEMSRLYLVNRYVLAIPEHPGEDDEWTYGGWLLPTGVGPLWPFETSEDGVHLVGKFRGYAGASYDALSEFDHFVTYGPRFRVEGDQKRPQRRAPKKK